MKRVKTGSVFVMVCIIFVVFVFGLWFMLNSNDFGETTMITYYRKEDFNSITIGKSTYEDVYNISSTESMLVTSYGGCCEYPMEDGGCVRIKFYGKDLVVGDIEEVDAIKG